MEKVSVIMPCYNDGLYIKEAVDSVLSQTYKEIELIIINDGSNDEFTIQVLSELEKYSTKIKILNTQNVGPASARNFGIKNSKGKFILPVDADDIIDKTYIEKAIKAIEQNLKVGIVYCYADLFGEKTGRWDLPDYSLEHMLLDNVVFVTALFYKADWESCNGFNPNLKDGMEDYDFWLSILELGKDVYQIKEVLFHYRIKPTSRTTLFQTDSQVVKETYHKIYESHKSFFNANKDIHIKVLRDALVDQIFINRVFQKGNKAFESIKRIPLLKTIVKKLIV